MTDQKIRNGFSGAAFRYDKLTGFHREVGERLVKKIAKDRSCLKLLDIGMGTGEFTDLLTAAFPDAMVIGIDFAPGMISRAQKKGKAFKIVGADASLLPFKENVFDMIASNLAYQWVGDLPRAFKDCYWRLKRRGRLHLTIFGQATFNELFTSLENCVEDKAERGRFFIRRLADKDQVAAALQAVGFRDLNVQSEYKKVHFSDMMALLRWIRDIGANALPTGAYIGKDLLARADEYYGKCFKDDRGVYATLEVLWVEARR